jgi:hypothetical protein
LAARKTPYRGRERRKRFGCCLRNLPLFMPTAVGIAAFVFVSGGCGRPSVHNEPAEFRYSAGSSQMETAGYPQPGSHSTAKKVDPEENGSAGPNPPEYIVRQSHVALTDFSQGDETSPRIALTFDAGHHPLLSVERSSVPSQSITSTPHSSLWSSG